MHITASDYTPKRPNLARSHEHRPQRHTETRVEQNELYIIQVALNHICAHVPWQKCIAYRYCILQICLHFGSTCLIHGYTTYFYHVGPRLHMFRQGGIETQAVGWWK